MKVVTAAQMRAAEDLLLSSGVSLSQLVARAGAALAEFISDTSPPGPVLILAGPGHNGDDGLVAGASLQAEGLQVTLYTVGRTNAVPFTGQHVRAEDDSDCSVLRALLPLHVTVVDSLLGTGQSRPVEGMLARIVRQVNNSPAWKVATDIPTGVASDTGHVSGEAFRASATLAMGLVKLGSVLYPGASYCGDVAVADLDLRAPEVQVNVLAPAEVAALLPDRPVDSNKGTYGSVLVAGGSARYLGAPMLSALGALRSGAGLAHLALPESIYQTVASHALEPVYLPLPESGGTVSADAAHALLPALSNIHSLVLGPGLGRSAGVTSFVHAAVAAARSVPVPIVIDADGLNALCHIDRWWDEIGPAVLTPHPGEMSRLTGVPISEIQSDRLATASAQAKNWGATIVLKGAGTVVASPDGALTINPTGGPNLATAGTGDVLSGIIGGLLAQGSPPYEAATVGVYLHGLAGDLVARTLGDAGTLASDLLSRVPEARHAIILSMGD